MNYKKTKLINETMELIKTCKDLETIIEVKKMLGKKPTHITDFIIYLFDKNYNEDIYKSGDIINAFEHTIRRISYELEYDKDSEEIFKKIEANSEYVDHFCEIGVDGVELDLWISENNNSPFDPRDIAWTIFNIYCGKVVFC